MVHVVTATAGHLPAIRTVLARGLADDPMFTWFFPRGDEPAELRLDRVALYLGPQVEWLAAHGTAHVALDGDEVVGAALWKLPDMPAMTTLPAMHHLHALLVRPDLVAPTTAALMVARRGLAVPGDAYLSLLAVSPGAAGRGAGRALMEAGAAAHPGPRWLETTNPANHGFYERLGYRVVCRAPLGTSGTELVRMTSA